MKSVLAHYKRLDKHIVAVLKDFGLPFLRYSLALVFIWFGVLKPLGFSPATDLVTSTVYWVSPQWFIPFLGLWELVIGVCLLWKPLIRLGLFLMALQMMGTFLPLVLLPEVVYSQGNPFFLTMEGQYIVKNLVLIGAGMVIGSHVRDRK